MPPPETLRAQPPRPLNLAVLISGGGTTMLNLADRIDRGELPAVIRLVLASNPHAAGTDHARQRGLPTRVVDRKGHDDAASFSREVFAAVRDSEATHVCLAGFLSLLVIPPDFIGRVLNIHPSLLPDYGGKGMHGRHVHEAVLANGETQTGCTVHFADNTYDTGPILLQRTCPVMPGDTAETLAARVFVEECEAYPAALHLIAEQQA